MSTYPNGPGAPTAAEVNFDLIGRAWELTRQSWGIWALAVFIVGALPYFVGASFGFVYGLVSGDANADPSHPSGGFILLQLVSALVGGALGAFFAAGLFRMAFKQLRGESPDLGTLFSGGDIFLPVWGATILMGLGIFAGSLLLIIPGLLLAALWCFTVPLIVDKRMGVIEAMQASFNALRPQMWSALGFLIVAGLFSALGVLVFIIGVFFTAPIQYLAVALLYRSFFPEAESAPRLEMPLPPSYRQS